MRYIISIDDPTIEQDQAFADTVSNLKFGYWHWLSGTWLITTHLDIHQLSDLVKDHFKDKNFLVNRVDSGTWKGFGPNSEKLNMFTWLNSFWK